MAECLFETQFACEINKKKKKKMMSDKKNRDVSNDVIFAYVHEKINILLSVLSKFVSFFDYDFILNTQGFLYLECVKYQLGLQRNVQVFAKCNVCISAIQLFYIQTCPGFRHISKLIVYLSDARVSKN